MQTIYDFITLGVENEHDLEHDLEHKPLFSSPKIYDADGDLSKRWYVYFSYVDPETGRLKRMKNIYGKTNRYKTKESRYYILRLYKRRLLKLLKEGYSPFDDNVLLHQKMEKRGASKPNDKLVNSKGGLNNFKTSEGRTEQEEDENHTQTPQEAFEYALGLKTNVVVDRTLVDYKSRCNIFLIWASEHYKERDTIDKIDKKLVSEFLNHVQLTTSPRNRNNFRTCLSSIFQVLEDNEIVTKNFIKSIKPLKASPKRNKTYSEKQHQDIFEYLKEKDPLLLLFIKFVSYNYLRPIEVCRLRIKDIDVASKTLEFQAKNKVLKTKRIPDILIKELPDLSQKEGDMLLFTPEGIGGSWETLLDNRRGFFSARFNKVVKKPFGLDKNYGLYSFRHTFITKLYRSLVVDSSPHAAKSVLLQITGHSTMVALEKYLRDIDAELPKDYSSHLN
ncbi:tyrosine-type recombinase/integrase [Algibacter mikhailovii]|uniref:tyrosine-type recombinase/integrase n=1 Tax=Algibacter mikhailovii TaxID=425498 RepID=UPI002494A8BE|nr:site-specific integrase [Algibacter mikhailovii]